MIVFLRESAFRNVYKAYGSHNNTLGATLAGEVKKMCLMRVRITINLPVKSFK